MKAKDAFDSAIARAGHFLTLYDLLCDTRKRGARKDWGTQFKKCMRWPQEENIVRIDGKERQSILVLREALGIERKRFAHDYLSELLRAAIVATVSALDRYMHDIVVGRSWTLLNAPEDDVPRELRRVMIPVLESKKALDRLRKDRKARPGNVIKQAIQKVLHRELTFQKPDDIKKGADMIGIQDFWGSVASKMNGPPQKEEVIDTLRKITARRNEIVHEADLVRKIKAKKLTLQAIDRDEAAESIDWMKEFVRAVDQVIISHLP